MTDSRAIDTNQRTNTTPGVSRREFVLAASAAAALPSLAGGFLSNAVPERRRASATLRIGLIGCGGRGTGAAVQALRADSNCELVAMGDVFSDRLENCLKGVTAELGDEAPAKVKVDPDRRFVGFDSFQKVIDSGVDVVLLCSYPAFRPAHLKAAVQAGKHIFAEKPLAVDGPGLRSVLESAAEARRKNLGVVVGFCWRFNDGMKAAFGELAKGTIGDIVNVQTTYLTGTLGKRPRKPEWSDLEFQMRNWWHFPWISGDHIVEQAVHSIDRLSWAVGDRLPERVICLGGCAARTGTESGASYDHFAAVYEYDGGMRTFHTCRQIDSCPNDNTDYVWGLKGSAVINGWAPTYSLRDVSGREVWKYTGPNDRDMYQTEHDELFASIRAGTPINDCERGANSTLMAIMARMAAYTGQTISWDQALNSKESLVPEHLEFGPFPFPELAVPGKTKFV